MDTQAEQFLCPGCGGAIELDVRSQTVCCQYCGTETQVDNQPVREFDLNSLVTGGNAEGWRNETTVVRCQGCGSETIIPAGQITRPCDFCGSSIVNVTGVSAGIPPEAIIPFAVDRQDAAARVSNYIKKRFFAPKVLKTLFQQDKLHAHYSPYWTFDARVRCPWRAEGGKHYTVRVRGSDGKTHTQTKTRWYNVRGTINHFFDDVLTPALKNPDPMCGKIEAYNTKQARAFDVKYLAGFESTKYDLEPRDAFGNARERMEGMLRDMVRNEVRRRYDEVRSVRVWPEYSNVTCKQLLVPVWKTSYAYRGKFYRVVINAQTGAVYGKYPISPLKVVMTVLGVLGGLTLLYLLISFLAG